MARLAPVKCPYCGQSFQREDIEFVQIGRRYAHKDCYDKVQQIHSLMKETLGESYSNTKINSQIKKMVEKENYTIQIIYDILYYWYKVKKSSAAQANGGIGIVPYIYAEYIKYNQQQQENKEINKGKKIEDFIKETKIVIGKATPITRPRHVKFYDLD